MNKQHITFIIFWALVTILVSLVLFIPQSPLTVTNLFSSQEDIDVRPQLSSSGVERNSSNSVSQSLENQIMEVVNDWQANGTEVYFEDSRVYLSSTNQSNNPIIRLTSKQYTGNINIFICLFFYKIIIISNLQIP